MTDELTRKMFLPLATVMEDDSTLREMFVGAKMVALVYEPPADDPLRAYGGFVLPQPLYYSRTLDAFFTLAPVG